MAFNGKLRKNAILAIGSAICLTIIVISSVFILEQIQLLYSKDGNEPVVKSIGAKVAEYLETRSSDVLFGSAFNNTFVNDNLSQLFNIYVDGFIIYGAPTNGSSINISVIQVTGVNTTDIDLSTFISVVENFKIAFEGLNTTSEDTDWMDIWPPTFMWDIGFKDNTSLSIIYSQNQHIITVVNGTWIMSEYGLSEEVVIDFPSFEYDWEEHYNRIYFILDEQSEQLIIEAINTFYHMIEQAF